MAIPARRRFVAFLAGIAALPAPRPARAQLDALAPLLARITGGRPLQEGRVTLEMPRLADNGNSVPLRVTVASAMTAVDHVRAVTLLSEKNPRPLMATFHLGPRAGRPELATRVRVNTSQRIVAVAELSDGSFWWGGADVEVTESACLDAS